MTTRSKAAAKDEASGGLVGKGVDVEAQVSDGELIRTAASVTAAELADPGATVDQADIVTTDPTAHKTWVTLPDGQRGWVKRERKDAVLVTLSIAGFDGETRWIHRDNLQSISTAD